MRICIVDDNADLNRALRTTFEENGYAIDSFTNSVYAQKHLSLNHMDYDLIILDCMMPHVSGLEICVGLRKNNALTPILMLTAVNVLDNKIKVLDSGADDYMTKPFLIPELLARVRTLLRRPQKTKTSIINVGDISLNTSTRKVTVGGGERSPSLSKSLAFWSISCCTSMKSLAEKCSLITCGTWGTSLLATSSTCASTV